MTLALLAALFLPLFPLSMVFNQGFMRLKNPWLRAVLLLVWPQIGIYLLGMMDEPVPAWFMAWAMFTALLYAYRGIALREAGLWIGFLATSAWALLWVAGAGPEQMRIQALAFSVPLILMTLVVGGLERRFGAVHSHLKLRLASVTPRYAGVFVFAVLAAVATPLFPGFFTMLGVIAGQVGGAPWLAAGGVLAWLLWTWSGMRLVQGILVGPDPDRRPDVDDLSPAVTWVYGLTFAALAVLGVYGVDVLLAGAPL